MDTQSNHISVVISSLSLSHFKISVNKYNLFLNSRHMFYFLDISIWMSNSRPKLTMLMIESWIQGKYRVLKKSIVCINAKFIIVIIIMYLCRRK